MTETASDGPQPSLSRAERRRNRSWRQRRRARRGAQRRDPAGPPVGSRRGDEPRADEPDGSEPVADVAGPVAALAAPVDPPAPTPTGPRAEPQFAPEVPDAVETPAAVERAPEVPETLEADVTTPSRRDRRRGGRARRVRPSTVAGASAVTIASVPEPALADTAPTPVVTAPADVAPASTPIEAVEAVEPVGPVAPAVGSRRARRQTPRRSPGSTPPAPRPVAPAAPVGRAPRRPAREVGDRRFWTRVMPAIAVLLVLAVVVGAIVRNGDAGTSRHGATAPITPIDQRPVLIVHRGPFGSDLIAIADRDGGQGSALLVPTATQIDVPSQGTSVLAAIPTLDGGALLTNSVENATGIRIGRTVVLDDAALTAALGPAAPFTITLNDAVGFSDRPAKYRAGGQQVSAAQASELMSAPESVNELDRLVVVASVLDGWMDRLRDPAIGKATVALQPELAPLVAAAGAPERRIDTMPVASIATGGGERFAVRAGELRTIVQRAFPHSELGDHGRRPRVEILNGTGALGVAQVTATTVVPAGGRIVNSDNLPGFGLTKTQIVYYRDDWRGAAQQIVDAMGCGSLRKAGKDVRIADVTILVGSDCPKYGNPGGGT